MRIKKCYDPNVHHVVLILWFMGQRATSEQVALLQHEQGFWIIFKKSSHIYKFEINNSISFKTYKEKKRFKKSLIIMNSSQDSTTNTKFPISEY